MSNPHHEVMAPRTHEEWIAEAHAAIESTPANLVEDHHKQVIAYLLGFAEAAKEAVTWDDVNAQLNSLLRVPAPTDPDEPTEDMGQ